MDPSPRFLESLGELGVGSGLLEELIHEAPFGVYVDHPVRGCVYANPALLQQFGMTWDEFSGFQWARLVVPEDAERIREEIQRYETSLEPIFITYRILRADGQRRWVHARAKAMRDAQGRHVGSISICEDVTEERVLRDQVAGSQKLEAVGRLAARIAHDFNNLLTVMLASTDLLVQSPKHPSAVEPLSTLEQAIEQACQITSQLLTLTRQRMDGSPTSALDHELKTLQPLVTRTLGEGVSFEMTLEAGDARVPLGVGQIGQVVLNLATNGHDAMNGYGRLLLRTALVKDVVRLEIQDFGEGMEAGQIERIFEPFFTTKAEGRGTGLGLTTVRDLLQVVGGRVGVSSIPGEGTTISVELPVVHDEYTAQSATQPTAPRAVRDATILLVEDQDALRQSLAFALALHGYRVTSARSLEEARGLLNPPPDVLVTDVMLSDGYGTQLIAHLRTEYPNARAVIISGFAGEATAEILEEPGRTIFLPKPFRPRDLLNALDQLLDD